MSRVRMPAMRILVVSLLFLIHFVRGGVAEDLQGHWSGAILLHGVSWPVELDVASEDSKSAMLSIPSLGMISNPINLANNSTDETTASFPFGIGELVLKSNDGVIVSHRKLTSGRRITLLLERIENYQLPYVQNEVEIPNGKIRLKGTTFIPKNLDGPVPGIVILHGSGPTGRESWEYRSWADFFARRGMAVLIYDKRPFEDVYPDLDDLADDADSVFAWFQNQSEIDSDRVGFFGGSQAGWLASKVASQTESNVAFIVMSGWPSVTPAEQEMHSIESKLRSVDLTSAEVDEAIAYLRLYFYVGSTSRLWQQLEAAAEVAAKQKWGKWVPLPTKPSDLDWWHRNHGFPTRQHLRNVSCPVLACYGEKDPTVPPSRNSQRLADLLSSGGNVDVTISVFDQANHRIEVPMIINDKQVQWPQLSPDYLKQIESWLAKRGFIK